MYIITRTGDTHVKHVGVIYLQQPDNIQVRY